MVDWDKASVIKTENHKHQHRIQKAIKKVCKMDDEPGWPGIFAKVPSCWSDQAAGGIVVL